MDVLTAEPQSPGALLAFHFQLPDGALEVEAHGQVAWANPNGQTGVHFLDLAETDIRETEGLAAGRRQHTSAAIPMRLCRTAS